MQPSKPTHIRKGPDVPVPPIVIPPGVVGFSYGLFGTGHSLVAKVYVLLSSLGVAARGISIVGSSEATHFKYGTHQAFDRALCALASQHSTLPIGIPIEPVGVRPAAVRFVETWRGSYGDTDLRSVVDAEFKSAYDVRLTPYEFSIVRRIMAKQEAMAAAVSTHLSYAGVGPVQGSSITTDALVLALSQAPVTTHPDELHASRIYDRLPAIPGVSAPAEAEELADEIVGTVILG